MSLIIKQYTVDAFSAAVFGGNPAAVCILQEWLPEAVMLNIARENNLSETAFVKPRGEDYDLRWFTPECEVGLCGHATLAAAFALCVHGEARERFVFHTQKSGILSVKRCGGWFEMDFPTYDLEEVAVNAEMEAAIGFRPLAAFMGRDLLCVLENETQVRQAAPDLEKVAALPGALLHLSARGEAHDCVSRSFAPKLGIDEDPVCGSGHCHIFPYWAAQLGKSSLSGEAASRRGGILHGEVNGSRTILKGQAVLFAQSEIHI